MAFEISGIKPSLPSTDGGGFSINLESISKVLPSSCRDIISSPDYKKYYSLTQFDENRGGAFLLGTDACQEDLTELIVTSYNLLKLAGEIYPDAYEKIGVSKKTAEKIYYDFLDYTDGELLATFWTWSSKDVTIG